MSKKKLEYESSASLKLAEQQSVDSEEQACRICGCTWFNACPGGCFWVQEDLCSQCVHDAGTDKDPLGIEGSPFN